MQSSLVKESFTFSGLHLKPKYFQWQKLTEAVARFNYCQKDQNENQSQIPLSDYENASRFHEKSPSQPTSAYLLVSGKNHFTAEKSIFFYPMRHSP
jgi:hypothetical protein